MQSYQSYRKVRISVLDSRTRKLRFLVFIARTRNDPRDDMGENV